MNTEVTINGCLYALKNIGDHVEALAAYVALAGVYPEFEASIKARYLIDQADWYEGPEFDHQWAKMVEAERTTGIPNYLAEGGVL